MGQYKSQYTGPQIDAGINAALNPDLVPTDDSDALITSDAVAKVQHGFAPIETAATAANSYAIGDLLIWGGVLYKAKTSITVGDSFVVDTNIEATTIADKLNNIDTEITSNTDTTLTGLLTGNGSKVGTKSLDTSSLTNDADHVPVSSVVKSALTHDLANIVATGTTNTTGATIASGTYFYLDGALVRAKANIAVNATFTSGTNYETVTAGGLNDLKSAISFGKREGFTLPYTVPCDGFVYCSINPSTTAGGYVSIQTNNDSFGIFISTANGNGSGGVTAVRKGSSLYLGSSYNCSYSLSFMPLLGIG